MASRYRRSCLPIVYASFLLVFADMTHGFRGCYTETTNKDRTEYFYVGHVNTTKNNYTCQSWASQQPHRHNVTEIKMANTTLTLDEAGNFCRPSPGHPPWCFTNNPEVNFDYCDIPLCDDFMCGDPPVIPYAKTVEFNKDKLQYIYACVTGSKYISGSLIPVCNDNGLWEGPTIVCAPMDCYLDSPEHGILYGGKMSTTKSGRECQKWTVDYPHKVDPVYKNNLTSDTSPDLMSNYCRGFWDSKAPWCYTTDTMLVKEFCDVPKCYEMPSACKRAPDLIDAVPSEYLDNETVIYRCKDGFNYISGSTESKCLSTGSWSLPSLFCAPTTCYYKHELFGIVYDGKLNRTMNGYTCQAWSSDFPHERNSVSKNLQNFVVDRSWEEASNYCRGVIGDAVMVWCYTTDPGVRYEVCNIPKCQVPNCGEPPRKAYATWQRTISTEYPAFVTYSCQDGFVNAGYGNKMVCQRSGLWTSTDFHCKRRNCKAFPIVPGAVPLLGTTNQSHFPSVLYYRCLTGYQYKAGKTFSTCDVKGQWEKPTITCSYPSCYLVYGDEFVYTGSVSVTKSNYSCQNWASQTPHRHSVTQINMAALTQSLEEAGNSCRPSTGRQPWCYTTNPDVEFDFCDIPQCLDVACDGFPRVAYQKLVYCEREINVCKHECLPGTKYVKGNKTVKCMENGQWVIPDIICAPESCYIESSRHGILYSGNRSVAVSGRRCQKWTDDSPHRIDSAYRDAANLTSDRTLSEASNFCRGFRDGKPPWCYTEDESVVTESCDVPKCDKLLCDKPPDLVDSIPSEGWKSGHVTYKCKKGYNYIHGSGTSHCKENGFWSLPDLFCAPTSCYYHHDLYGYVYDGSVSLTVDGQICKKWIERSKDSLAALLQKNVVDKSWEEASNYCRCLKESRPWCYTTTSWKYCDISQCEVPDCREPSKQIYAVPTKTEPTTYPNSIPYACANTYKMIGDQAAAKCQKNGQWSSPSITCEVMPCLDPPVIYGTLPVLNVTDNGHFPAVLFYTCRHSYKHIRGEKYITCQGNGQWTEIDLFCVPTTCYNVHPKYGVMYAGNLSHTQDGDSCQEWTSDYPHVKDAKTSESANYVIDGSIDKAKNYCRGFAGDIRPWCYTTNPNRRSSYCSIELCKDVNCGQPPSVSGLTLLGYDHTYVGGRAKYTCRVFSVKIKGVSGDVAEVFCQTNAKWESPDLLCAPTTCYRVDPKYGVLYAGTVSETATGIRCQLWVSQSPHTIDSKYSKDKTFPADRSATDASNYCRTFNDGYSHPWCYTSDPAIRWGKCAVEKCQDETCSENEFECPGARCIPQHWRCDQMPDCSDASDEKDCKACPIEKNMCMNVGKPRQFETSSGQCCDCPPGLTGPHCEECDSEAVTCYNNGTLTTRLLAGNCQCQCTAGFTGANCDQTRGITSDTEKYIDVKIPKLEHCLTDPIDITIVADGNFLNSTEQMKDVETTTQKLLSYFGNDRVGLLTYNTKKIIQIDNKIYTTEDTFLNSLDGLKIENGNISLAEALETTRKTQMTLANGKRLDGLGIVIIFTNWLREEDAHLAVTEADLLRENGIHVVAVGATDVRIISQLVGTSENVFPVNSLRETTMLYSAQRLALSICEVCDATWTYYGGSCYKLYTAIESEASMNFYGFIGVHWMNAKKKCDEHNSHLVSISDAAEERFLLNSIVQIEGNIHIGLKRTDNSFPRQYQGMYRWIDGKPPTYLNWKQTDANSGQPKGPAFVSCVTLSTSSQRTWWKEVGCGDPVGKGFICETNARNFTEKTHVPFVHPPVTTPSANQLFRCKNGEFILNSGKCDGQPDCFDKSDEENCGDVCTYSQFTCMSSGQCVSLDVYCDQINDCLDKTDETECVPRPCKSGEWTCSNRQCINSFKVCDLTPDCLDGSDEQNCNTCKGFRCTDGTCIPYSWQCDGTVDCSGIHQEDERSNLCSVLQSIGPRRNVLCHWKTLSVYKTVSRDLTLLDNCRTAQCDDGYFKCPNSYCIPVAFVCNGIWDCINGDDEYSCENYQCPGYFKCRRSKTCIGTQNVCNNHVDCPEGDDELLCHFTCPSVCSCTGSVLTCTGPFLGNETFGALTRKLDFSSSDVSQLSESAFQELHLLVILRMSNCRLQYFKWNVRDLKNLLTLDLSYNNITHIEINTFTGLSNLRKLDLSNNKHLTKIDIGAFDHLQKLTELRLEFTGIRILSRGILTPLSDLHLLNISFSELRFIENDAFENQTELSTLDLQETSIIDFGENVFVGLDKLEYLHAGIFTLCCPQVRPASVKDDKCFAPQDEFSSCEDLMQNNILRIFIWILGMSALIGNILTIACRLYVDKSPLSKGSGYFILNLGLSDFLMGVYMTFLGTADMLYRGKYLWYANVWKSSTWCKIAGSLSTLSSEASTMFICLVTLDRFLGIQFPFGQVRFTKKSYRIACAVAWVLSAVLAFVPLLPSTSHWNLYGRNSVCLALPLSRTRLPGWEYSTSIFIGFNMLAFTFIAAAQIVIYRAMKGVTMVRDSKRLAQERAVARKLTLVVLTDFLCWFPVGIMGLAALGGVPIAGEVYAWTAVFILPVNSALNPFLYTFFAIFQKRSQESKTEMHSLQSQAVYSTRISSTKYYPSDYGRQAKKLNTKKVFVGSPESDMQPLLLLLKSVSLNEAVSIVDAVYEALPSVEQTVQKHENLTLENVFIDYNDKEVSKVCFNVCHYENCDAVD